MLGSVGVAPRLGGVSVATNMCVRSYFRLCFRSYFRSVVRQCHPVAAAQLEVVDHAIGFSVVVALQSVAALQSSWLCSRHVFEVVRLRLLVAPRDGQQNGQVEGEHGQHYVELEHLDQWREIDG